METAAAARRWTETWTRAWPVADVEAVVSLYADDAVFYSHPLREQQAPAEYVAWAFGEQREAECRFGEPLVERDRAAVGWWGVITDRRGEVETIAGTSLLRFDAKGQVVEQRDVWAAETGRRVLPDWPR